MTIFTRCITSCIFISFTAIPVWCGEYLLYTPKSVPSDKKISSHEGILVQEIEVQKGDTLFDISRKFSGHGMYYPQILLFNSIKNPDLIYPGNTIKVPLESDGAHVSGRSEASKSSRVSSNRVKTVQQDRKTVSDLQVPSPNAELTSGDLKPVVPLRKSTGQFKNKRVVNSKSGASPASPALSSKAATHQETGSAKSKAAAEQLFQAAVKAYRADDCSTALKLLDSYLAGNSNSPLAADASLFRAECYLKLSAQ